VPPVRGPLSLAAHGGLVFRHVETEGEDKGKSLIVIRSILIAERKTSVSVEDAFWDRLKEIAADRNMSWWTWSPQSTPSGNTTTCHPPFACSCSTTIAGKPSLC
jgi:hypothetical protein